MDKSWFKPELFQEIYYTNNMVDTRIVRSIGI